MSYSVEPLTDNCYKGTTCFINKPNIRDASKLRAVEGRITFAKKQRPHYSNAVVIFIKHIFGLTVYGIAPFNTIVLEISGITFCSV